MDLVEDIASYFADFGDAGTLDGVAVRVIFDHAIQPQLGGGLLSAQPSAQIATASVPSAAEGLTLVTTQGSFVVRERLDDGTGITVLTLHAAA